MGFTAQVYSVLIASPGDVAPARDAVESVIRGWNADRARASGAVLLPLRWELNAVSDLRLDPQSAINEQLVDHADIVIGLFDARLGTPTPRALSGTVEELERGVAAGVHVHAYFSDGPLPRDLDIDQLAALRQFQAELRTRALLTSYSSIQDLVTKVRSALEKDVTALLLRSRPADPGPAPLAVMRVSCEGGRQGADGRAMIEVRNTGRAAAERLKLALTASDGGALPIHWLDEVELPALGPSELRRFPLYLTGGATTSWSLEVSWEEHGTSFRSAHRLTLDD